MSVFLCVLATSPAWAEPSVPGVPPAQLDLVRRTYRVLPGQGVAYLAATVGVVVVDTSDLKQPRYVGSLLLPNSVNDLTRVDGKLVAALGPAGIVTVDVRDPRKPKKVGAIKLAGAAMGVTGHGKHVLVASGTAGLQLVDLSDPTRPRKVAHRDTPGYARAVRVQGTMVYLADGPRGVQLMRIDGTRLVPLGALPTRGHVYELDVVDKTLVAAEGHVGVSRYDLTRPDRPRLTGRLSVRDAARGVDLTAEGRAAVSDGTKGLIIVDTSGKTLREISRYAPERSVNSAALLPGTVLVANDYDGLLVLNVDGTGKMSRVSSLPAPGK